MEITRLLHVSQSTPGALDASASFYVDVLGLKPMDRPALAIPGLWLATPNGQLHLNGREPGLDPGSGPRPAHVCLGVVSLDAAIEQLDRREIEYREAGSLSIRQVWLRDPAGNPIELQQDLR